jgi:tetratricopeptide (TPR) repeat protein
MGPPVSWPLTPIRKKWTGIVHTPRRLAHIALLTGTFLTATPSPLFAHADLEEQIAVLTAQIEKHPTAAELFLRRADLYRRHAQTDEALADLAVAEQLKPDWPSVELVRARLFGDLDRIPEALSAANKFLKAEPAHPDALAVRARCYAKLNRKEEAIADYSAALSKFTAPAPDLFLERARAQADLARLDDAVKGLDEGMAKLGEIPSFQLAAIEFERQRANFDAALARVDKVIARYPVKEPWLTLRAEVLEQSDRDEQARETLLRVLAGIEKYPEVRRSLELTKQLEIRARDALTRVESKSSPLSHPQPNTARSAQANP